MGSPQREDSTHSLWAFSMPFTSANAAVLDQLTATSALTQLNRKCVFPKTAIGNYENVAFNRGDTVTVRRTKIVTAQDFDPRAGSDMTLNDIAYASGSLTLDRLFVAPFRSFGSDPNLAVERYVPETGVQIAEALKLAVDDYMYNRFRTYSIASTGNVSYGVNGPVGIVASTSSGALSNFNKSMLINASSVMQRENVPTDGNLYGVLSTTAGGDFLGDSVMVEGFVSAYSGTGGDLLTGGFMPGQFVDRYGFMTTRSNAVGSQTGVADLDTAGSTQATLAIASVAANTAFTKADYSASTVLGAVNLTLTCSTALSSSVAVGQIARIGVSGSVTAFGVILRIDNTTPTAPVITLVPYSPSGGILTAAQITAGTDLFSIPSIPSISVAYHKEALLYATRPLQQPSDGAGAVMTTMADPDTGLALTMIRGSYNVLRLTESTVAATLIGAVCSDYRKAVLMLSL